MPDKATQKKATEGIRDIYQEDYKTANADDLARKLLKSGQGNLEESGRLFVTISGDASRPAGRRALRRDMSRTDGSSVQSYLNVQKVNAPHP